MIHFRRIGEKEKFIVDKSVIFIGNEEIEYCVTIESLMILLQKLTKSLSENEPLQEDAP